MSLSPNYDDILNIFGDEDDSRPLTPRAQDDAINYSMVDVSSIASTQNHQLNPHDPVPIIIETGGESINPSVEVQVVRTQPALDFAQSNAVDIFTDPTPITIASHSKSGIQDSFVDIAFDFNEIFSVSNFPDLTSKSHDSFSFPPDPAAPFQNYIATEFGSHFPPTSHNFLDFPSTFETNFNLDPMSTSTARDNPADSLPFAAVLLNLPFQEFQSTVVQGVSSEVDSSPVKLVNEPLLSVLT